jgi:hypothetical protein
MSAKVRIIENVSCGTNNICRIAGSIEEVALIAIGYPNSRCLCTEGLRLGIITKKYDKYSSY